VPTYAKVKYKNAYPGVDLVYYGNQRQLEYDFVVGPGADPNTIMFDIAAVSDDHLMPYIDPSGDLVIPVEGSEIRFHKPLVYQTNANGEKEVVAGNFVLKGKRRVGFALAAYDHTRSLVIVPATYLGGAWSDPQAFYGPQ